MVPEVIVICNNSSLYISKPVVSVSKTRIFAPEVWVADSRVKNFSHPQYIKLDERSATTWPDLDESPEFRNVSFYRTLETKKGH